MISRLAALALFGLILSNSAIAQSSPACEAVFSEGMPYRFEPRYRKVGDIPGQADPRTLLAEPMLFSAEWEFARKNGGELTQTALAKLAEQPEIREVLEGKKPGYKIIVDSRVHVLSEEEFPAIPGWHTDFVPRPQKLDGQPDYTMVNRNIGMFLVNVSNRPDGVSNTEFIKDPVDMKLKQQQMYMHVDRYLDAHPEIAREKIGDGQVYFMDQDSLHRGTQAHNRGIRFFLRAAILDGSLVPKVLNEVRTQVQSYRVVDVEVERANKRMLKKKQTSGKVLSRGGAKPVAKFQDKPLLNDIKAEPILQQSDWDFAKANSGPLTKKVLEAAEKLPDVQEAIKRGTLRVNTRVHMLQAGQNVDFARWKNTDPFSADLVDPSGQAPGSLYFATFSTKPEGLNETLINARDFGFNVRSDRPVESIRKDAVGQVQELEQNVLYKLSRGVSMFSKAASKPGWKLTVWFTTESTTAAKNRVMVQVPVFLEDPSLGW